MNFHYIFLLLTTSFFIPPDHQSSKNPETTKITTTTYNKCTLFARKGEVCQLNVAEIHPTQFSVGMLAVNCTKKRIEGMSEKKLRKWLGEKKRRVPTIIGPDGNFYITDRHHLATSLYYAKSYKWGELSKNLNMYITYNLYNQPNKLSMDEFWNNMLGRAYRNGMPGDTLRTWLYDENGKPSDPRLLPDNLGGLLNDPYRTLSRWVRESCGYIKKDKSQCSNSAWCSNIESDALFLEFYWGNFLRKTTPLSTSDEPACKDMPYSDICLPNEIEALRQIFPQALKAVTSEEAKQYFSRLGKDPKVYGFNECRTANPVDIDLYGCDIKRKQFNALLRGNIESDSSQQNIDLDEYYFEEG